MINIPDLSMPLSEQDIINYIRTKYECLPKESEGIKLRLDWRVLSPLRFIETISIIHQDSCRMYSLQGWDEDNCDCNPKNISMIIGRINVFRTNGPDDSKKYFTVCISIFRSDFEQFADKNSLDKSNLNLLWEIPDCYPNIVEENIANGKQTLYTMLKYYEATGEELDFFNTPKNLNDILLDRI